MEEDKAKRGMESEGVCSLEGASRASGVPAADIEAWEERFGAVRPVVGSGGAKGYTPEDVERLRVLRLLLESGYDLGEVGALPMAELRLCLGEDVGEGNRGVGLRGGSKCRVEVAGVQVLGLLGEPDGMGEGAEVVRTFATFEGWATAGEAPQVDLLILECAGVFPETVEMVRGRVEASGALRAVVVYQYLKAETLAMMDGAGSKITALRAPVTARELKLACEADVALAAIRGATLRGPEPEEEALAEVGGGIPADDGAGIPERQFSDYQLSKISQMSTAINCECPHHLGALLTALNAFEDYSRDCENRDAKDAALHAYLHRRTARARAIMEDALVVLAEAEGIQIR